VKIASMRYERIENDLRRMIDECLQLSVRHYARKKIPKEWEPENIKLNAKEDTRTDR
jgi:hypothetical protein